MRTTNTLLALLCAFALAAGAAAQSPKGGKDEDKLVLENDHVTVWFQGKKPMLKVFPTANATDDGENVSGAYSYKFTEVVEYRDLDGDGAPSDNEVLASLNLNAANAWTVNRSQDGGATLLNLTLVAPVKMGPKTGGVPLPEQVNVTLPDRVAEVSLNFTIRGETTTIDAAGVNVTVPATSVKYDFGVARWPFVDPTGSRLALVMHVHGALGLGNATGEGVEGATVAANQTRVGALSWTTAAQGTTGGADAIEVPVKTSTRTEGDLTRLVHTYDAAGLKTLLHDPTIGVAGDEESLEGSGGAQGSTRGDNPVPGPAAALAIAGIGAVALALRGRRSA